MKKMTRFILSLLMICCIAIPVITPAPVRAEQYEVVDTLPIEQGSYSCYYSSPVEDNDPKRLRADITSESSGSRTGSSYAVTASMEEKEGYYPFIKGITVTAYYRADAESDIYSVTYTASGYGDLSQPYSLTARVFAQEPDHIWLGVTCTVEGWYEKGDN